MGVAKAFQKLVAAVNTTTDAERLQKIDGQRRHSTLATSKLYPSLAVPSPRQLVLEQQPAESRESPSIFSESLPQPQRVSPILTDCSKVFDSQITPESLSQIMLWYLYWDLVNVPEEGSQWYEQLPSDLLPSWIRLGSELRQHVLQDTSETCIPGLTKGLRRACCRMGLDEDEVRKRLIRLSDREDMLKPEMMLTLADGIFGYMAVANKLSMDKVFVTFLRPIPGTTFERWKGEILDQIGWYEKIIVLPILGTAQFTLPVSTSVAEAKHREKIRQTFGKLLELRTVPPPSNIYEKALNSMADESLVAGACGPISPFARPDMTNPPSVTCPLERTLPSATESDDLELSGYRRRTSSNHDEDEGNLSAQSLMWKISALTEEVQQLRRQQQAGGNAYVNASIATASDPCLSLSSKLMEERGLAEVMRSKTYRPNDFVFLPREPLLPSTVGNSISSGTFGDPVKSHRSFRRATRSSTAESAQRRRNLHANSIQDHTSERPGPLTRSSTTTMRAQTLRAHSLEVGPRTLRRSRHSHQLTPYAVAEPIFYELKPPEPRQIRRKSKANPLRTRSLRGDDDELFLSSCVVSSPQPRPHYGDVPVRPSPSLQIQNEARIAREAAEETAYYAKDPDSELESDTPIETPSDEQDLITRYPFNGEDSNTYKFLFVENMGPVLSPLRHLAIPNVLSSQSNQYPQQSGKRFRGLLMSNLGSNELASYEFESSRSRRQSLRLCPKKTTMQSHDGSHGGPGRGHFTVSEDNDASMLLQAAANYPFYEPPESFGHNCSKQIKGAPRQERNQEKLQEREIQLPSVNHELDSYGSRHGLFNVARSESRVSEPPSVYFTPPTSPVLRHVPGAWCADEVPVAGIAREKEQGLKATYSDVAQATRSALESQVGWVPEKRESLNEHDTKTAEEGRGAKGERHPR